MKKSVSHIVKPICFLLIFLMIFIPLSEVFREENGAGVKSFYAEPKNSLDVVFVGPSTTYSSFYPMELWKQYGIASYAFATPSQVFADTYYALREAVTQQSAKLFVIDVSLCTFNDTIYSTAYKHLFTDTLRFSPIKTECIQNTVNGGKLEYYIPFISYHTRWKGLTREDYMPKFNYGKGGVPNYTVTPLTPNEWAAGDETENPGDVVMEYLDKMLDFCDENNLNVLFTSPANNTANVTNQKIMNGVGKIVRDRGYSFINLRDHFDEMGLDLSVDFRDTTHTNAYGAKKVSAFLGQYLKDNYDLPDRRNDPAYESWNDAYDDYVIWSNNYRLTAITDFNEYLSAIDLDSYTVVMAVRDDAQKFFSPAHAESFKALGLTPLPNDDSRSSYIAVINSGKAVYQKISAEEQLEKELTVNGVHYVISSAGLWIGDMVSIKVNGKQCAIGKRGINIVVYDNWSGEVVDRVCFDTHIEALTCRRS